MTGLPRRARDSHAAGLRIFFKKKTHTTCSVPVAAADGESSGRAGLAARKEARDNRRASLGLVPAAEPDPPAPKGKGKDKGKEDAGNGGGKGKGKGKGKGAKGDGKSGKQDASKTKGK